MAKMSEGEYYYYLPHMLSRWGDGSDKFYICRRDSPHPNYTVIADRLSQDNASLIVDALNQWEDLNKIEREYEETVRLHPNGPT